MTPLDAARGITEYLTAQIDNYGEALRVIDEKTGAETLQAVHVYTGFLPRRTSRKEMQEQCPAIVVRPEAFQDGKKNSRVSIVVYVTVYDEDMTHGSDTLFHFMEFVRMMLLSENPVNDRWLIDIDAGLTGSVPDDQPFPQWIGLLEFDVYLPQPKETQSRLLRGEFIEKKKN